MYQSELTMSEGVARPCFLMSYEAG